MTTHQPGPTPTPPTTSRTETVGIAPKVKYPLIVLLVIGAVLLVLGLLIDEKDIWIIGVSAIGSALTGAGVGYQAPPGLTVVRPPV
jgi:hypothetical protein